MHIPVKWLCPFARVTQQWYSSRRGGSSQKRKEKFLSCPASMCSFCTPAGHCRLRHTGMSSQEATGDAAVTQRRSDMHFSPLHASFHSSPALFQYLSQRFKSTGPGSVPPISGKEITQVCFPGDLACRCFGVCISAGVECQSMERSELRLLL